MTTKQQTLMITSTICSHYDLTIEEFYNGKSYRCADARKIALRILLDLGVAKSITDAATLLNTRRTTASMALKSLGEILPYNRVLRGDVEAITAICAARENDIEARAKQGKK